MPNSYLKMESNWNSTESVRDRLLGVYMILPLLSPINRTPLRTLFAVKPSRHWCSRLSLAQATAPPCPSSQSRIFSGGHHHRPHWNREGVHCRQPFTLSPRARESPSKDPLGPLFVLHYFASEPTCRRAALAQLRRFHRESPRSAAPALFWADVVVHAVIKSPALICKPTSRIRSKWYPFAIQI
jgi:hypothetical protein